MGSCAIAHKNYFAFARMQLIVARPGLRVPRSGSGGVPRPQWVGYERAGRVERPERLAASRGLHALQIAGTEAIVKARPLAASREVAL